mgnify:CR=1 FL=1
MTLRRYVPSGLLLIGLLAWATGTHTAAAQETDAVQKWSQEAWSLAQSGEPSSLTTHLMAPPTHAADGEAGVVHADVALHGLGVGGVRQI